MRVLIIGGTQFMGREVVRRLVARGDDVSVLHRRDHHDLGPGVHNLQADRADFGLECRESPVISPRVGAEGRHHALPTRGH